MEEIVKLINECNGVRYPSYRAAQKLQILQKELNSKFYELIKLNESKKNELIIKL